MLDIALILLLVVSSETLYKVVRRWPLGTFRISDKVNAKRSEPLPLPVDKALRDTLGRNLRAARIEAGLSQEQLADSANLSRKHVGRIERGIANVSIDVLAVLAAHVGKTPIDLLTPQRLKRSS